MISSLNFNPTGEYIATIDCDGLCVISDVSTDEYRFQVHGGSIQGESYH